MDLRKCLSTIFPDSTNDNVPYVVFITAQEVFQKCLQPLWCCSFITHVSYSALLSGCVFSEKQMKEGRVMSFNVYS